MSDKGYQEGYLADAIRTKMKRDNKRFWAGDNISDYVSEEMKHTLIDEATEAFELVLDRLLIDRETDPNSHGTARRLAKMYFNEIMEGRYEPGPDATAFPATETITFNVVLDRTNDFACANAKFERPGLNTSNIYGVPAAQVSQYRPDQSYDNKVTERGLLRNSVREFSEYYSGNTSFQTSAEELEDKLIDLFERGTISDVEYLYRAINGPGTGDTVWTNRRGIQTADIGFLMPTLLNIDIGPLAYKGYVTSLGVQHMRFTPDMIPISTNVSISLNVLATAGLTSRKV